MTDQTSPPRPNDAATDLESRPAGRTLGFWETLAPVPVDAGRAWNPGGLAVRRGELYEFGVVGNWTCGGKQTGAAGLDLLLPPLLRPLLRCPAARRGELVGAVGHGGAQLFRIGAGTSVEIQCDGELGFFANDLRPLYWSNAGVVRVTIRRIA